MSKFIDLEDSVEARFGDGMSRATRDGVRLALGFLDAFPGRAPSSQATAMSESDVTRIFEASKSGRGGTRTALTRHRIEIVPDPEPTDEEKLKHDILKSDPDWDAESGVLAARLVALGWVRQR